MEKFYTKFTRLFYLSVGLNLFIAGFNCWTLYYKITTNASLGSEIFTVFLIVVNSAVAVHAGMQIKKLKQQHKDYMWKVLSTPESEI